MPKFYRKVDGSYYYIKASNFNSGIITYQLADEERVLDLLERHGYRVRKLLYGEKLDFSSGLLNDLRDLGLVYTGGSGTQPLPAPNPPSPHYQEPQHKPFQLALEEDGGHWQLSIVLPTLPQAWFDSLPLGQLTSTLGKLKLCVAGREVPAMALWPSKGGLRIPVELQESEYSVSLIGEWPAEWNAHEWAQKVTNPLAGRVELFAGADEGGVWLPPYRSVSSGKSYYVVMCHAMADLLELRSHWPFPKELAFQSLGRRGDWEAWAFQLPEVLGQNVTNWLSDIQHPAIGTRWKLMPVSPPPLWFSAEEGPIYKPHQEIIVHGIAPPALTVVGTLPLLLEMPKGQTLVTQIEPGGFLSLPVAAPGLYKLRSLVDFESNELLFAVAHDNEIPRLEKLLIQPAPLRVQVRDGEKSWSLGAFGESHPAGGDPALDAVHELVLQHPFNKENFVLGVECDAVVSVSWHCGAQRRAPQVVPFDQIHTFIAKELAERWPLPDPFQLRLDAGAFGNLSLHFKSAKRFAKHAASDLALSTLRRARWLSLAIPARLRCNQEMTVLLGAEVQKQFNTWAQQPGAPAPIHVLAGLTHIPVSLLPQLRALAHELRDCDITTK